MTDNKKNINEWKNIQKNEAKKNGSPKQEQLQKPRVVKRAVRWNFQWWKVKQWSNIWWKWILIWIWIFVMVLVLLMFFFFFYLTANPNMAKTLWMWAGTVKSVTSIFAWLLFWILFIIFLFMWLSYIYKLMTQTSSKWRNIAWAVIVFFLWVGNIVFGWVVFARINAIQVEEQIETKDVLIANMTFTDPADHSKVVYRQSYKDNFPLIAPTAVSFTLNNKPFLNNYLNPLRAKVWNILIQKFMLDCWNWQTINYDPNIAFPLNKYCLYMKKWEYRTKLKFIYNSKNLNNQTYNLPWKIINIKSEVEFKSNWKLNDNKTEIIAWERTDEVSIDLRKIPNDFWMKQNSINIDFEWKWDFILEKWIVKHTYNKDGLYNMTIKLPWEEMSNYPLYSIPIRISPSTKPTCTISMKESRWKYLFTVEWSSPNGTIRRYNYTINNITNWSKTSIKKWKTFSTPLSNGSDYQIEWTIIDNKWNTWRCVSNTVELSGKKQYTYDIVISNKDKENIEYKDNTVTANKIPEKYKLEIKNLQTDWISIPLEWDISYGFDTNWDWKIDEKSVKTEVVVKNKKWMEVNAIIKDIHWNQEVKTIKFIVNQKPVVAVLTSDQYKWEAPLIVKFDASTSQVNNENDSIVYFDWQFGDWNSIKQTKQGNIDHAYDKPWTYIAKVSVETEKWEKDTASRKIFVLRQWKTANIIFPENLWWQSKKNIWVKIELQTDWLIKNIARDFGDWEKLNCQWRECVWVNHSYKKKWIYKVSARVEYTDGSPSVTAYGSINIID